MRESLRKILEVHQGGNGCMAELEFEKPVVELRNKIRELKDYTKNSGWTSVRRFVFWKKS